MLVPGPTERPPPGVDIHNLSDGLAAIGCGRYAARRLGMNRPSGVVSAVGAAGAARFFSIWASSQVLAAAATRLLRVIISKTAGREDYGAQLGDAAATTVVEVHEAY